MRLTVIGSGSAFGAIGANAAYCVDGRMLVDCGAPMTQLLPRAGIDVHAIDMVLVTHFHYDHVAHLPLFLGARALESDAPRPLALAGPPGTFEYVERLLATGYGAQLLEAITRRLKPGSLVLQDGTDVTVEGYRLRAFAVVHSRGPSLAYAITGPDGATVGFSGDTTVCAGLHRAIDASDLFVCECTGWDGPVPTHLWSGEVAELMRLHPRTRFLLSHLAQRGTLAGALVAHDRLTLDVTATDRVLRGAPGSGATAAGG